MKAETERGGEWMKWVSHWIQPNLEGLPWNFSCVGQSILTFCLNQVD